MAMEKRWAPVPSQLFIADGSAFGTIQISDSTLFKVKQVVLLKSNTQVTLQVEIKRVIDKTTLIVGPIGESIDSRTNVAAFLVADGASISSPDNYQLRPKISNEDSTRAVYEEEPTVAIRTIGVNALGEKVGHVKDEAGFIRPTVDAKISGNSVSLFTKPFDCITATYPNSTTEIYQSHIGGISGAVQEIVTVSYTDSTKNLILSAVRE